MSLSPPLHPSLFIEASLSVEPTTCQDRLSKYQACCTESLPLRPEVGITSGLHTHSVLAWLLGVRTSLHALCSKHLVHELPSQPFSLQFNSAKSQRERSLLTKKNSHVGQKEGWRRAGGIKSQEGVALSQLPDSMGLSQATHPQPHHHLMLPTYASRVGRPPWKDCATDSRSHEK